MTLARFNFLWFIWGMLLILSLRTFYLIVWKGEISADAIVTIIIFLIGVVVASITYWIRKPGALTVTYSNDPSSVSGYKSVHLNGAGLYKFYVLIRPREGMDIQWVYPAILRKKRVFGWHWEVDKNKTPWIARFIDLSTSSKLAKGVLRYDPPKGVGSDLIRYEVTINIPESEKANNWIQKLSLQFNYRKNGRSPDTTPFRRLLSFGKDSVNIPSSRLLLKPHK